MRETYHDIISRINELPSWYDENGCPRYGEFSPGGCPNIYSNTVVLMLISCQSCGEKFRVQMSYGIFDHVNQAPPRVLHYGDPPAHGCVGDTMNCDDIEILEVWHRDFASGMEFVRVPELEGTC